MSTYDPEPPTSQDEPATDVSNPTPAVGGDEAEASEDERSRGSDRLRHRDRAVSAADYERLATQGFPRVGRTTVVAVFVMAVLALGALLLSQLQGPRDRATVDFRDLENKHDKTRLQRERELGSGFEVEGTGELESAWEIDDDDRATEVPPTSLPSIEINFNADVYTIERGECTTLRWQVSGASRIHLRGQEVEEIGADEVCPSETTGYTLLAENDADEVLEYLEVAVTEPTDDRAAGCWVYNAQQELVCQVPCQSPNQNQGTCYK